MLLNIKKFLKNFSKNFKKDVDKSEYRLYNKSRSKHNLERDKFYNKLSIIIAERSYESQRKIFGI